MHEFNLYRHYAARKKTVSLAEKRDLEDKVMVGFMRRQLETENGGQIFR
jgi:hypothetical protein